MKMQCSYGKEMFERLLNDEQPGVPTQSDLQHAENCRECRENLDRIAGLDRHFEEFFDAVREIAPTVKFSSKPMLTKTTTSNAKNGVGLSLSLPLRAGIALGCALIIMLSVFSRSSSPISETRINTVPNTGEWAWVTNDPRSSSKIDEVKAVQEIEGKLLACMETGVFRNPSGITILLRQCRFRFQKQGIEVKAGHVTVEVPPKKKLIFIMTTPVAVLGVRGTRFEVDVTPSGATSVKVREGIVDITTVTGEKAILEHSQSLVIDANGHQQETGQPSPTSNSTAGSQPEPKTSVPPETAFH